MEQTVSEAAQQASEAGLTWWLHGLVEAATIITLFLLIYWRVRDSQTRLKIDVLRVEEPDSPGPRAVFNVLNKSKHTVLLDKPRLTTLTGEHTVFPELVSFGGNRVSPEMPIRYTVGLYSFIKRDSSGAPKAPVTVRFVIEDGSGKCHEKRFIIAGVGGGSKIDVTPEQLPFYKSWYHHWFGQPLS
jgi:hypothetical protein